VELLISTVDEEYYKHIHWDSNPNKSIHLVYFGNMNDFNNLNIWGSLHFSML